MRRFRFLVPVLVALGLAIPLAYAADTLTTNLLLTNQEAGGNLNTWGDIADANYERIDAKLGDTTTVSTTGGTTTLTSTQELVQIVKVTGTLVSNVTLTFSCRGGYWLVSNETSGAFTVTAKCSGQTGAAITQGAKLGVYSDGTDIRAVGASGTKAVGEVFDFAGTSCPAQSLEAYGQELNDTTYSALLAAIGTTYGVGGASTFNAPDLRGRVVAGEDDMGGTSANRLTAAVSQSPNGDTLGAADGEEVHTPTLAEIFAHTHTQQGAIASGNESAGHTHTQQGAIASGAEAQEHTHTQQGAFTSGNPSANHSHTQGGSFQSGGFSADHSHSGSTSSDGNHDHSYTAPNGSSSNTTQTGGGSRVTGTNGTNTGSDGNHNHSFGTGGSSANHSHATTISGQTGTVSSWHTHDTTISGATTGRSATHTHTTTLTGETAGVSANHTHTTTLTGATASTGSTTAFNQVQPTIILKKCIYTGV